MEKLKILKKYLILSIILFSIFLINTKEVKAYGNEVDPMLDLNSWNVSFDIPNENNLNLAKNWVSNYCKNYNHYVISTQAFYETIGSDEIKDKNPIYVYCFNDNLSLKITSQYYGNNSNIKYLDIGSSKTNGIIKYFYDNGLEYYPENNTTGPFSSIRYSLRNLSEIKFPYIETNIEDIGLFSNKPVLSRGYFAYNSIKYNDLIYNVNDKFIDFENNSFDTPTSFKYEISDGTNKGKKLSLFFNNYKDSDYAIINNYQTGEEIKILNLKNNNTKIFDNISQDNTFIVVIYNENDEIILTRNIDIQEQLRLTGERYILVGGLNIQELNSYFLAFYNTEKKDKCFYKFKNEEEQEINCNDESIVIKSPNKNTYVENYIKNKKGEIVVKKNVNLNYLKNLPQFKFESYYDDNENKQILKIIVENLQESDIISYSYDNKYFYTLETKRINYLDFYNSSDVYFKVERNSEVISEAYFDVVYNSYVNSSNNNNLENTNFSLKNLLDSFKNYSENNKTLNISADVYNQLKNSKLGLYIIIIITGSFIILFVKSIKR